MLINPWMMVPVRKDPEADPACHANTDIQPKKQYKLAIKMESGGNENSTCNIT